MTKICIPIREKESEQVLQKIALAEQAAADLIEIWLGEIKKPDIKEYIRATKLPILVNCKGQEEQGSFTGKSKEKQALLLDAIQAGASYVDISADSDEEIISEIIKNKGDVKIILSKHYFSGTPGLPHLTTELAKIQKFQPDIVKFAAMPRTFKDVVTMIRLAEKLSSKHISHIVISMGKLGKITRIASPVLKNEIMFASLEQNPETTLGQISIKNLHRIYNLL